jgi:hypothetical protein
LRKWINQDKFVCMSTGMLGLLTNRFHLDPCKYFKIYLYKFNISGKVLSCIWS